MNAAQGFTVHRTPLISIFQAKKLLEARAKGVSEVVVSLDLGLSKTKVRLDPEGVWLRFEDGPEPENRMQECMRHPLVSVPWKELQEIGKEERRVFRFEDGRSVPVQVFSEDDRWVRSLCPSEGAPTVLVSGIPMHRIKATDPMKDTAAKLKSLGRIRGRVLDTATGLGYTAIGAARSASEVVTIELDPAALEIASWNPWSHPLFELRNIRQHLGDTFEVVLGLEAGGFQAIIHDPPTMALGGELYSEEMYRRLHRVLRKGGIMFHYVGDPNSALGAKLYPGVGRRLRGAGFKKVSLVPEAFGLVATN